MSFSDLIVRLFSKPKKEITSSSTAPQTSFPQPEEPVCCGDIVHIVYRGVSDDKLYIAYDRKWQELKFFRPKGLRVFCKKCRRRLY